MFDLTKEITLEKKWQRKYLYSRLSVFAIFILTTLFVAYKILFPSESFKFSFNNPSSTKNSILNMEDSQGAPYENGAVTAGKNPVFDTMMVGDFSEATVGFNLEENSPNQLDGEIEIRKSHQAFLYPLGKPLGFKNGSLLKNGADRFIVSDGAIRKFSSSEIINEFGFKKEAFIEVTPSDLTLNSRGDDLTPSSPYPADSIFHILDEYFQLKNGTIFRFVSEKAYLSQYSPAQAIDKDPTFLNDYSISEDYIGFSDGTLLSADISVYIASGKNIHPVNNPVTFESDGYLWSDIIPANSEEIGMYEEQKLFTIKSPHPEGTIFHAQDSGKYYYIQNDTKREITSQAVLATYPRANYIPVSEESLTTNASCSINPRLKILGLHSCKADISAIKNFPGNDYHFSVTVEKPIILDTIDVEFNQAPTLENMKKSLGLLKGKIFGNYGIN